MNNEYKCLQCINKPVFKSNIDLIKHLKLKHCLIDNNNLYTCLYGSNGRCLISSDKLNQKEFDEHIIKSHLCLDNKAKNNEMSSINQQKLNYESFNKSFGQYIMSSFYNKIKLIKMTF